MLSVPVLSKVIPLSIVISMILASILTEARPFISLSLIALVLYILFISMRWSWLAERFAGCRGSGRSRNIIARMQADKPGTDIVFLAHYDSKSQTIPISIRMLSLILFLPLLGIWIFLIILKTSNILLIGSSPLLYLGLVSFLLILPHLLNFNGNRSPGALDNASGVGVMLELARVIKENYRSSMPSFTFIATGAEEEGLIGSIRFMKKHAGSFRKEQTFFINLDSPGAPGKTLLIDRCGIFARTRSGNLTKRFIESSRGQGIHPVRRSLPPGIGVDSFPISYRGFEAITLSSGTLNRTLLSMHTPDDSIGQIDGDVIENLARSALAFSLSFSQAEPVQKT